MVPDITCCRTRGYLSDLCSRQELVSLALPLNIWQVHSPRVLDEHLPPPLHIVCNKPTCCVSRGGVRLGFWSGSNVRALCISSRYSHLHEGHVVFKVEAFPHEANLLICWNCDSGVDTTNLWWRFVISAEKFCKCGIVIVMDGFSYNST